MNEYLTYFGIGLAVLFVALFVPGIKLLAEFILKNLLEGFFVLIQHKWSFVVWAIKTLFSDHARVIRHATTPRDVLDPTQKIRRKLEGYEE